MIFPDAGMIISHKQSKQEHRPVADIWEVKASIKPSAL